MELKGKKLLVLGGSTTSIEIIDAARKMGVYTIVTDWYDTKRSPAKLVADEFWDISILDYDRLVDMIEFNHINGIITGFTDSYLLPYQHLCELTGLPCYASKEVFELTMDKARFKQLCRDNNVTVIPEYSRESFTPEMISSNNKVIIKPIDNSGSRGVILCESPEDYDRCLNYALSYSDKKEVVIEKYMEMDSMSASYTIQDGVLSLSTTDDRFVHKSPSGSSVTRISFYPSRYTDLYLRKMDKKVREMYRRAGIRNGVLSVQFFTDGNEFYAMEMGHRLTGGQHYTYTLRENGISALDCLIHFSITGRMADYSIAEKDNAEFNNVYCHLFLLGRDARICRIEGFDYLQKMPEIISLSLMKGVGDMIGTEGTAAQKVVGMHLMINRREDINQILEEIYDRFHVFDENNNELILKILD